MKRAFTLLELSFVLAIIAVMMTAAVPFYEAMLLRSRAAEAPQMLQALAHVERDYFRDHGHYLACGPSAPTPPRGTTAPFEGGACFRDLGFRPDGAMRFTYQVQLTPSSFEVIAHGDLNGNGKVSTYLLHGDTLVLATKDELE